MTRSGLLQWAAIGAGGVVVVAVAVAAFLSMQTPFQAPVSQPGTTPCTPEPCLNIRGYIMWVSNVSVGSGLVSMQLTFRNASAATHADPADVELVDAQNHTSTAVHDAPGCTGWPRTDFNNGATFGPVAECFRPATTAPPLTLRWNPDFGFFCCQADVVIEPVGASASAP